jgi:hypothetical protein
LLVARVLGAGENEFFGESVVRVSDLDAVAGPDLPACLLADQCRLWVLVIIVLRQKGSMSSQRSYFQEAVAKGATDRDTLYNSNLNRVPTELEKQAIRVRTAHCLY